MIAKEKSALTRRELQEIVVLTSKLTTQLGIILTSKGDLLFSSFGISALYVAGALTFSSPFMLVKLLSDNAK